jgi:hypothetical protein
MKKILLKFAAVLAIIGAAFMFACEEPIPDCERYDYGDVIVENSTGLRIKVDVTEGSSEINNEKWLSSGGRTTYSRIDAGSITIWASIDGYDWVYDDYYLDACEELTYTWYLNNKKSAQNSMYLEITNRNGDVLKTVDEFQYVKRN